MRTLYDAAANTCTNPGAYQLADVLRDRREGLWLDIEAPDEQDYELLATVLDFHPLTIEDVRHRNQRPKLEEYSGYAFAVLFAAEWQAGRLAFREHHLYLGRDFLVTVHQEPEPELRRLTERLDQKGGVKAGDIGFVAYLVMDAIVDGVFTAIEELDDEADRLQDAALATARPENLAQITALRHDVATLRRQLGAERDVFQRLLTTTLGGEEDGPSLSRKDMTLYYRDVYDHLVRQYEQVDGIRDLLGSAMDVYLSSASNRLNETMRALTAIASLFLPLTFLTGFFGQNFGWLVSRIGGVQAFTVGLALMAASVALQLLLFRRRGWI